MVFIGKEVINVLGERLQEIRKDNGDTQQSLADKLQASLHIVRCWEQDRSDPSQDTLIKICQLYHVSSDYLLGLKDDDDAHIVVRCRKLSPKSPLRRTEFKGYYEMFGMNVVYYRRRKRLTQVKLAELVGIGRNYMGAIEMGRADVSFDVLFGLCEVLEIAPQQLFYFQD